jgi:integrase
VSARSDELKPRKRKGHWYFVRRVPQEFAHLETRSVVFVSTRIRIVDDPFARRAKKIIAELDQAQYRIWREKRSGGKPDAQRLYDEARQAAARLGFVYVTATEGAATLNTDEIVRRFETLGKAQGMQSEKEVAALLGGVDPPSFMVSDLLAEFAGIHGAVLNKKSPAQQKKWRNPKQTALDKFIEVIGGDKPFVSLTRLDAIAWRNHWNERVMTGGIEIDTANKNIGRISVLYKACNSHRQLGLPPIFDNLRIAGALERQRVAFDPEIVRSRFFAEGMFADLNEQARRIIFLIAETGLRLSEACNLSGTTICLDGDIPHIQVRPEGREMKTADSLRDIPLVGAALQVMKLQPCGFPRYRDNADSLSALVNQALTVRGLREGARQSLYSLRHTFEDRLTAVEAPEKVVASLMGHKWHRPKYGKGPTLEQKQKWLQKIAFKPPADL